MLFGTEGDGRSFESGQLELMDNTNFVNITRVVFPVERYRARLHMARWSASRGPKKDKRVCFFFLFWTVTLLLVLSLILLFATFVIVLFVVIVAVVSIDLRE